MLIVGVIAVATMGLFLGQAPPAMPQAIPLQAAPVGTALFRFFVQNYDFTPYDLWIQQRDPSGATSQTFVASLSSGSSDCLGNVIPSEVSVDVPATSGDSYSLLLMDSSGNLLDVAALGVAADGVLADEAFTINSGALLFQGVTYSPVPPVITTEPASQTVLPGQTATFTVVASGGTPLTYVWQENGAVVSGATSATYTTPPVSLADDGAVFYVFVSNGGGSATGGPAILSVGSGGGTGGGTTNRSSSRTEGGCGLIGLESLVVFGLAHLLARRVVHVGKVCESGAIASGPP